MGWYRKKKLGKYVGVEIRDDGIAVVSICSHAGYHYLQTADFLPANHAISYDDTALRNLIKQRGLQRYACNVVVPSNQYQLLLIEAPDVPESEMSEALRWKIKDLVNIPLEDLEVSFFFLPSDGTLSRKRMAYAIVASRQDLKAIVRLIKSVDLRLESIDIGELAMRNLAVTLVQPESKERVTERGVAIVRLLEGQATISLFKQGNLYLSRQFDLPYSAGLLDALPVDALALEVQRSLDYYERQMGQAAPTAVYICGDGLEEQKITDSFEALLTSQVKYLDAEGILATDHSDDQPAINTLVYQSCVGAIGASLRRREVNHAAG